MNEERANTIRELYTELKELNAWLQGLRSASEIDIEYGLRRIEKIEDKIIPKL